MSAAASFSRRASACKAPAGLGRCGAMLPAVKPAVLQKRRGAACALLCSTCKKRLAGPERRHRLRCCIAAAPPLEWFRPLGTARRAPLAMTAARVPRRITHHDATSQPMLSELSRTSRRQIMTPRGTTQTQTNRADMHSACRTGRRHLASCVLMCQCDSQYTCGGARGGGGSGRPAWAVGLSRRVTPRPR
jgi:hypothetical protein